MNYDLIDRLQSLWSRRLIEPLQRNDVPSGITTLLEKVGPFALAAGFLLLFSFIAMLRSKKNAQRRFQMLHHPVWSGSCSLHGPLGHVLAQHDYKSAAGHWRCHASRAYFRGGLLQKENRRQ